MKRPVEWTETALFDLRHQAEYIAFDSPAAARRIAARVREVAKSLGDVAIGRPGATPDTYEKPVSGLPYTIIYAIRTVGVPREVIFILRVVHQAQRWPPEE